ncbi:leucine zipper putative tumor suppressor 2 homolog [Tubulanus polymorphus]|uniref:leucine zipper putative tumor suppressor 2 homolog n=1 Tax=Tubulanus polymorphus TaxID=672921 RepID=UPI003DA30195
MEDTNCSSVDNAVVLSNDILFTEDEPGQTVETSSIYSTPSVHSNSSQEGTHRFSRDGNYSSLQRRGRRAIYQKHRDDSDYGFVNCVTSRNGSVSDDYAAIRDTHRGPPPPAPPRPKPRSNSYADPYYARHRKLKATNGIFEDNYTLPNKPMFASRRNTWSPPAIQRADLSIPHCSNGEYAALRNYSSNSDSHTGAAVSDRVYEMPDIKEPAKLPPQSGVLNQSPDKVVLRPLAFKPVVPQKLSPPIQPRHDPSHSLSDEGYSDIQTSPGNSGYGQIMRKYSGTRCLQKNGEHTVYGAINKTYVDRPRSQSSSSRLSSNAMMTPSPSDSGVGEIEALLRDKDAQINQLRETMDQNERVIFQVLEEKQIAWELEMDELKRQCQDRVKFIQQKASKAEQSYMLQVYKLQQEKLKLQEDSGEVSKEKDAFDRKCKSLETDLADSKSEVDTLKWEIHQKSGEISLLKSQIKEAKEEIVGKASETLSCRTQVKDLRDIINGKNVDIADMDKELMDIKQKLNASEDEIERLKSNKTENNSVSDKLSENSVSQTMLSLDSGVIEENKELLDATVLRLRAELLQQREEFETEREIWLEEKNKVICYQKQLQLNYVQMYRKNKMLEADIEQLTLDLERRDMQLLDNPPEEESAC